MLELVRAAVLDRDPIIPKDISIDWDKLMDHASEQGVLAWVWDSICKLPDNQQPSRIQRINFGMSAQEIWDRYEQQNHLLNNLISTCSRNDMRLLLLKGISLSQLYPKPKSRPCGDLDIFLFEDYDRFNQIYADNFDHVSNHHSILFFDEIVVENHFDFLNPHVVKGNKINRYLKSTLTDVTLTEQGYYILSPMATLIYLTSHAMQHLYCDLFMSMRGIMDFGMFLDRNRHKLPPQNCFNQLKELKMGKGFEVILYMTEYILGLSFVEYHQNRFSTRYLNFLHRWIICYNNRSITAKSEELGLLPYFKQRIINSRIRRFMLKFKKDDKLLKNNLSGFVRALFRVPSKMSIISIIKRRFGFHCKR